MNVLNEGDEFEYVGNRFKNLDLLRFFNKFHKYYDEGHKGIGRIKSPNKGEFFSGEYLDFLTNTIGTEKGLEDFLKWTREELLTREHVRERILKDYKPKRIIEILILLFNNQRNLQHNPNKPLIEDLFNRKVLDVLNEVNTGLSENGLDVFKQLETTFERGFFPISSQGELLIFIADLEPGIGEFLSFPSAAIVKADKKGTVIETNIEVGEEVSDEVIDAALDEYFGSKDPNKMSRRELVERIYLLRKFQKYHNGEGNTLSETEYQVYRAEIEKFTYDEYDCEIEDIRGSDLEKRIREEYSSLIDQVISGLTYILRNNHELEDMSGVNELVQSGAIQLGPREL